MGAHGRGFLIEQAYKAYAELMAQGRPHGLEAIADELETVRGYLSLMQRRMGDRLRVRPGDRVPVDGVEDTRTLTLLRALLSRNRPLTVMVVPPDDETAHLLANLAGRR